MSSEPGRTAGLPEFVEIAGHRAAIDVTERGGRVQLRVSVAITRDGAALLRDELAVVELEMPGDGRARIDGDAAVLERDLFDPSATRVNVAAHDLAKRAIMLVQPVEELVAAVRHGEANMQVAPPVFAPQLADVDAVLGCYYTVPTAQNGWDVADPALPPTAVLQPGSRYYLVERIGNWARVESADGTLLYTDGRTLMPAVEQGAQ